MICIVHILLVIQLIELCNGCPLACVCKWKNGKQTVECINKDLLVIPDGMDSGTQVLEFSGNNLQTLHQDKFLKMDLINLQRIYMSKCRITYIDDRTFKGLTNLVELDLSSNQLAAIPTAAFHDCPSLMRLMLNTNPIKTLDKLAFNHLTFLNTLELSNCEISTVDETAFQGLYSLEWLHLDGNKMSSFGGTRHLPEALKGVQLEENPWECDCHILELHAWLRAFSFPHSVEPVCQEPFKLSGRTIKSVPTSELACLADISPTTLYLEIEEGKNISLLCQIHAVPEAKVSWFYQGELLQNDSMIAPGVHLFYYIEEGAIDKRSELFIYNANVRDNGTFICNAENPAGVTQANFTIRVIVKQEVPIDADEIPFEFILIVVATALALILLLMFSIILSIIKCQRSARLKKKRNDTKEALRNTTKDNLLQESIDDSENLKESSNNIKLVDHEERMILYSSHPNDDFCRSMSPLAVTNQIGTTIKCYQFEQNPDLINGTESVGRGGGDSLQSNNALLHFNLAQMKNMQGGGGGGTDCNALCMMASSDVHLNPVGLLKAPSEETRSGNCYRTLPYNRANKRQTAANPIGRYSREAEFLSRSNQPASYEHYGCDVRYTADGYPVRPTDAAVFVPSSPDSHKSAASSTSTTEPCCSTAKVVQWPSCVPANFKQQHEIGGAATVIKKCVGAQTQTDNSTLSKSRLKINSFSTVHECADENLEDHGDP